MNFDLGEVLSRAWQITWKQKTLWWFGVGLSVLVLAIFPLAFVPISFPLLAQNQRTDLILPLLIGYIVFLLLFFVIMFFGSALIQTAITLGILQAQDEENISIKDLLKNSLPFFSRVLGVMFLYGAVVTIINLVIQTIIFVLAISTFGVGMICATPLYFLIYPLMFAAIAWMEQAINGVIIDDMAVMDAVKQGWQIIRNNIMAVVLVMIIVYFGIGMVSTIAVMPMVLPFFVLPMGFLENEPNWTIISLSLLFSAAFVPLFVLFSGWSIAFTKSAWVLTYLRLTRSNSTSRPVLLEAAPS